MSDVTEKVRSRGHWLVVVRPEAFCEDRVSYEDLDSIIERSVVRFRGWPVPFIDRREGVQGGVDWIGQDIDAEMVAHYEAWRFFTSGQFTQMRSVSADWRAGRESTSVPPGHDGVIEVWEILFYLTEVFELAARLALSPAGDNRTRVEVTLEGLRNRALVVGQANRVPFVKPYRSKVRSIAQARTLHRDELVGDPTGAAATMAREFFVRFGWKPATEQLAEHQRELIEMS